MQTYSEKTALFVGNLTTQTRSLLIALEGLGVSTQVLPHGTDTVDSVKQLAPDLLVLDAISEKTADIEILNELRISNFINEISILVLVNNTQQDIQNIMTLGAADFFTDIEEIPSVLLKINILLGESNNFSGAKVVDLNEAEPLVDADGVRVFIVEDDPLLKNLLSLKLEQSKFPVEFSENGENIVQKIIEFKPEVIVLDLMLPGVNGLEILQEIKKSEKIAQIPVIIFSNRDEQSDRVKATELGAAGFYVKALTDLSELIEIINNLAKR